MNKGAKKENIFEATKTRTLHEVKGTACWSYQLEG